jgi:uncharacterized SAM-binding protein YcdF (DUF218 family)
MRRFLIILFSLVLLSILAYTFRTPVLRWFATSLIVEDPLQKVDALVVLSGGGYDRGNEAVKIIHAGYVNKVICTGGNPVIELRVFGIDTLESDMTVANLRRLGIPDSIIETLHNGTSTKEEAEMIAQYCSQHQFKKIMVLSSKLHTHRVWDVFKGKLKKQGIEVIVRGAPSSRFDELTWWQDEEGLIAVNNEWIKRFYYWWKYGF